MSHDRADADTKAELKVQKMVAGMQLQHENLAKQRADFQGEMATAFHISYRHYHVSHHTPAVVVSVRHAELLLLINMRLNSHAL